MTFQNMKLERKQASILQKTFVTFPNFIFIHGFLPSQTRMTILSYAVRALREHDRERVCLSEPKTGDLMKRLNRHFESTF